MIRLALILMACLFSAMLIWGQDAHGADTVAITTKTLPATDTEVTTVIAASTLPDPEAPEIEVARLQTADLTTVRPVKALLVFEATDAPAGAAVPVAVPEDTKLLVVTGSSVNMRAGPSIGHSLVGNLRRGAQAELVAAASEGWLQIRDISNGRTGYMSARFLKPVN